MRTDKPEMVGWEITRRCNLACAHCYTAASAHARDEMTTAECVALIGDLARLGAEVIGWTGGEPLLRGDLEDLVAAARAAGLDSGVTTNGILLDAARAASLRDAGMTFVQVSLDGSTAERNAVMRGATAEEYDRILDGIRVAREAGLRVNMAMVLGEETLDDAPRYLELARSLEVPAVRFCGFVPAGRGQGKDARRRLSFAGRDRLRAFVEAQDGRSPRALFDPAFGPLPPHFLFHECMAGTATLYIGAHGDVYPCTSLIDRRFRVGNVRERSLDALWNDPRMTEIARFDTAQLDEPCRSCAALAGCHGGCRGIALAHTGRLEGAFPVCLRA